MKIKALIFIAISTLLITACGSKEVRVAELNNSRYIVQNDKTGKLGVQFQTEYMQQQNQKPIEILPTKFDKIDCAERSYFVQWGDSAAVYSAPEGMSEYSVKSYKIADLKSYDIDNAATYGVPVVMPDGSKGHYFAQKYSKSKNQTPIIYNTDILLSNYPENGNTDYLIAGPYDKLYDGFTNVVAELGGFTHDGLFCYVVERDGKFSIGNSFGYNQEPSPFATQWFDDLIIIQDPGKFIYLCCKNVSQSGVWDVMLYEFRCATGQTRRVDQLTDEQLASLLSGAKPEEKCSDKVYRFKEKYPFNRMNNFW